LSHIFDCQTEYCAHAVLNLCGFPSSEEHKRKYSEKIFLDPIDFHCIDQKKKPTSNIPQHIFMLDTTEEIKSYRLGMVY